MAEVVKTIGDKQRGFKFTNLTIEKYCKIRGIEFFQFDDDRRNNILASNNAMFRAAIDVYSKGQDIIDEYECDDMIEKMAQEDFNDIIKAYVESMSTMLVKLTGATEGISKKK
jgi:hypothetical protein